VGVGVVNPGSKPASGKNLFGIMLKDYEGSTVDANMKVPGLSLKVPEGFQVTGMAWSSAVSEEMSRIRIGIRVLRRIPPGRVAEIVIVSPEGVMYHDPRSVTHGPDVLPEVENAAVSIAGNHMMIKMKKQEPIEVGRYDITFQVKNPSTLPNDNTWTVLVTKDQSEIRFSHVLAGYTFGARSPEELLAPVETSNARNRWSQRRGPLLLSAASTWAPLFLLLLSLSLS